MQKFYNYVRLISLIRRTKKGAYLIEDNYGRNSKLRIKLGDLNFTFFLITVGTYILYEIGKVISDNNDDDDMDGGIMLSTADGAQA